MTRPASGALIAEAERAEALGLDPSASAVWAHAPWSLRVRYADGRMSRDDFWLALRRLLRFAEEADDGS